MVPKAQDLNPLLGQKIISLFVASALVRKAVSATVQLHCQSSRDAEGVEKVNSAGILAAKLELFEAPITKQPPETLLRIR